MLGGGFSKLLNKDIKELNKVVLTFCCVLFLVCVGIISYKTNNSYALFSDSVTGTKTIEVEVKLPSLDKSGANEPVLDEDSMIPVYYDTKSCASINSSNMNKNDYPECYTVTASDEIDYYDEEFVAYCARHVSLSVGDEAAEAYCLTRNLDEEPIKGYEDLAHADLGTMVELIESYYKRGNFLVLSPTAKIIFEDVYNLSESEAVSDVNNIVTFLNEQEINPVLENKKDYTYKSNNKVGVWKKADIDNSKEQYKWYDYDNKMWANSVTVSNSKRNTYLNAELGTEIDMNDILTMQVWIPRYKYKVWNYNAAGTATSTPQQVEITWEKGTRTTEEISCQDSISGTDGSASETCKLKSTNATCTDSTCNNKSYTHPAFTFGDMELKGFWIGKFELTGTLSNITTKPDLQSLRNQKVGVFEVNIMNMKNSGNIYGFDTNIDTHMAKNSEWGAVAYLSHSKYGTCTNSTCRKVYINNSSDFYTGRSGGNIGGSTPINGTYTDKTSTTNYNTYGFYTYDGYLLDAYTNIKTTKKNLDKVASTTGNIYGVYDMSGGAYEYTMANVVGKNGTTMISGGSTEGNSGYTGIIYDNGNYTSYTGTYSYPANKYIDKYSFGTSNTSRIKSKLGDGIKEVYNSGSAGWYSDYSYVAFSSNPWFLRGGTYSNGTASGTFTSFVNTGYLLSNRTVRLIIATSA